MWHDAREMTWAGPAPLVKVATTLGTIAALDARLDQAGAVRRFGAGGEVAWVGWTRPLAELDAILTTLALPAFVMCGPYLPDPYLGRRPDAVFLDRVRQTFDPRGTFGGQRSKQMTNDE